MAAAITRAELQKRGWTHVSVASAGAATIAGHSASEHAQQVLQEHGIDISDHQTQQLTPELVAEADLVLVMSNSHLVYVIDAGGAEKAAMITDFLDNDEAGMPIEDPFGAGLEAYQHTYQQLSTAVNALLARLEPILSP
jgi:protein-tyrosine-phosphatase